MLIYADTGRRIPLTHHQGDREGAIGAGGSGVHGGQEACSRGQVKVGMFSRTIGDGEAPAQAVYIDIGSGSWVAALLRRE